MHVQLLYVLYIISVEEILIFKIWAYLLKYYFFKLSFKLTTIISGMTTTCQMKQVRGVRLKKSTGRVHWIVKHSFATVQTYSTSLVTISSRKTEVPPKDVTFISRWLLCITVIKCACNTHIMPTDFWLHQCLLCANTMMILSGVTPNYMPLVIVADFTNNLQRVNSELSYQYSVVRSKISSSR